MEYTNWKISTTKKIAVPTRGNEVDDHFGNCEKYTVFTINNNKIENTEIVASPQGCGCKSNIATVLKDKGVSMMLAGNMGNGALNVLKQQGISVIRGCSGNVKALAESYVKGELSDSGIGCEHHGDDHECNH